MASIEANLKRIQESDDLSYSQRDGPTDIEASTEDGKKLDPSTLARLIDECREEQEQQSLLEVAIGDNQSSNTQIKLYQGSELGQMQLARIDQQTQKIHEANSVLESIKRDREIWDRTTNEFNIDFSGVENQLDQLSVQIEQS